MSDSGRGTGRTGIRVTITMCFVILIGVVVGVSVVHKSPTKSVGPPTKMTRSNDTTSTTINTTTESSAALSRQLRAFYALETKGLDSTFSATYLERGVPSELGGDKTTVTTWNTSESRAQAFEETSAYGDDELILTNSLTSCFRPQGGSWTCSTTAQPLMGAQAGFQMNDPPIFIELQVGNFPGVLQSGNFLGVTAEAASVVDERVGGRLATCLSASAKQPKEIQPPTYQIEKLHVCLTSSGVPISFSQSGIDTGGTDTDITLEALSSTVMPKDFVPPSRPSPGG
jgi:hypothetical protein